MSIENNLPLVKDATRSQSESVQTIVSRMQNKEVYIPDYQRDSDQWNDRKKSLFIESLLNNLTIPAFFFCEDDKGDYEVVDGQQRLTTILQFVKNQLRLSDELDVSYLIPQAAQYRDKIFSELTSDLQKIIKKYPLTIIFLPKSMHLSVKLEVFRRINEGGTPLTGQDIRLAYYSESNAVAFIRLCGLHSDNQSSQRMLEAAEKIGLSNPWDEHLDAKEEWYNWWSGR